MSIRTKIAVAACLLSACLNAFAEAAPMARSAGKLVADDSLDLVELVKSQSVVKGELTPLSATGLYRNRSFVANRHDQHFSIYEADVELIADIDGDGYHHAFNVIFDVDVDVDGATLYAKLYLSRDGGPWIWYNTSNLFDIFEDDAGDAYEVTTELVDGYPPGYYAVLVEIYSLNHADIVASVILDHNSAGRGIMLEDLARDDYVVVEEVEEITEYHGGGSFSLFLYLLLVQVVTAARGVNSFSPRKTTIRRKGVSALRSFLPNHLWRN